METELRTRRELRKLRRDAFHGFAWAARRLGSEFDPREPETSIQRLAPVLGPGLDLVTRWRIGRMLVRAKRVVASREFGEVLRHAAARNARRSGPGPDADERGAAIDAILDRAHRLRPFSPLAEFQNLCVGVDPPEGGWPGAEVPNRSRRRRVNLMATVAELCDVRGERRVRVLLSAWKDLCETQYAERVLGLANVVRRGRGATPIAAASIGQALSQVRELGDPSLLRVVDLDAALFRNAHAHSHFRYLPTEEAVSIWDRSIGPRTFTVAEIEGRLERAAALAFEVVPTALRRFVVRRCLISTGLLHLLIEDRANYFGTDEVRRQVARSRVEELCRREFAPLDRLDVVTTG